MPDVFKGRSRDGLVEAEVDRRGRLLSLDIPLHVLRGAHPERIGPACVEAVAAAREVCRARIEVRRGSSG